MYARDDFTDPGLYASLFSKVGDIFTSSPDDHASIFAAN